MEDENRYQEPSSSIPSLGLPQNSLDLGSSITLQPDRNAEKLMSEEPVESETDDGAHTTHFAAALDANEADILSGDSSLLFIGKIPRNPF